MQHITRNKHTKPIVSDRDRSKSSIVEHRRALSNMLDHSHHDLWPVRQDISMFDYRGNPTREVPYTVSSTTQMKHFTFSRAKFEARPELMKGPCYETSFLEQAIDINCRRSRSIKIEHRRTSSSAVERHHPPDVPIFSRNRSKNFQIERRIEQSIVRLDRQLGPLGFEPRTKRL
jgi:hypothetical protein